MAEYLSEEDMNTDEYISRDVALRQLNATCLATDCDNYNGVRCIACAYADAMDFINAIPAAEVQPVKRGRWEQIGEQSAKCTACGGVLKSNGIDKTGKALIFNAVYHYCPYCGARMMKDGDTNDEHIDKSTMDYVQNEVLNYLFNKEREVESMPYSDVRQERIATLREVIRYVEGIGETK